ncbi:MAG: hypothetical protein QNJ37_23660 [Crocosphaera sp.]|nr:hypothetical protein [Crocosphaera sp.]
MIFKIGNTRKDNNPDSKDGLKLISDPKKDNKDVKGNIKDVKGNIIFVHGLGADRYKTWNYQQWLKKDQFWPKWLAEDLLDFGVWLFGYKTKPFFLDSKPSASSLDDIAKFLINEIADRKLDQKPLIFITHSLGGLVVKTMLKVADNKRYLSILQNTKGVVFIATPHNGSELATMVKDIRDNTPQVLEILESRFPFSKNFFKNNKMGDFLVDHSDFLTPTSIVETLIPNEAQLNNLTDFYQQQSKDLGIVTLAFYEMYDMWGFTVVDKDSANPEIRRNFPEPINKNHVDIAKCESPNDILYKVVKQFIVDYKNKLEKINKREEKHFEKVSQSLEQGNLIFFIGSGINSTDKEKTVLSDKTERVIKVCKFPPSDQKIADELTLKSHINTDEIIGTPCQICPIKPKNRPVNKVNGNQEKNIANFSCPVMQKIDQKRNTNQQLIEEENLAFAKLQIRCHGQFIKEINGSIDKILQGLYRNPYECNELQKLLVEIVSVNRENRKTFPLIITTNYDYGIEKAFEKVYEEAFKQDLRKAYQEDFRKMFDSLCQKTFGETFLKLKIINYKNRNIWQKVKEDCGNFFTIMFDEIFLEVEEPEKYKDVWEKARKNLKEPYDKSWEKTIKESGLKTKEYQDILQEFKKPLEKTFETYFSNYQKYQEVWGKVRKEFHESGKDIFSVVYYSGDYTLEKGYITEANPNWKLISYKYQNDTKLLKIDDIKRLKRGDVEKTGLDEETLKKHPVLIKLCGGQIYGRTETENQWRFAISGVNSLKDFANTRMLSTLVITDFCRTHDILFLGYSATDAELQDILDTLVPPILGREKYSKGWLINQSDIGELNKQIANYWYNWHIEIDHNHHNYSWKNYLKKLWEIENLTKNNHE